MPQDVLEQLSNAIGRQVKPAATTNGGASSVKGLKTAGNIDIKNRPIVPNPEHPGDTSTMYSTSIGTDQGEVLIPRVSDGADGKPPHVMSVKEATDYYKKTKKHLGIFDSPASATAYAQSLHEQQSGMGDVNGRTASLESVIGRPLQPAKLSPLAQQRFKLYGDARKNGIDVDRAMKTAMATAATAAPTEQPSTFQKVKSFFGSLPEGPGSKRTLGDVGNDLGEVMHRAWSNPMAVSDERWAKDQKAVGDYVEGINQKHLGKGALGEFATGVDTGAAKFLGEQASPGQVALLLGTFGESALVRAAYKVSPEAVPAARTLAKLVQAHFIASMVEGTASGIEGAYKSVVSGDWKGAGEAAIETLASAAMAKGAISHEQAQYKVRGDMEAVAREKYGMPDGQGVKAVLTSRFDQLNPFQQGAVIEEAVKRHPDYQAVIDNASQTVAEASEKTKAKQRDRLADYYGTAMSQAWDANVARRTIQGLQRSREVRGVMDATQRQEEHVAKQQAIAEQLAAMNREMDRKAHASMRQVRRQEGAQERSELGRVSEVIADRREQAWGQRQEAIQQTQVRDEVPHREVEAVVSDTGQLSYPAFYWGEENTFGVAPDVTGHAVYRQTPRGVEWLGADGNFSEAPGKLYTSHDPAEADTMARLNALGAHTSTLADEAGASAEQIADADRIADIRRDLVSGEIDVKEAQRRAGISEKSKLPDEFTAARDGKLNGPFHESSANGYYEGLRKEAADAGMSEEETNALLDESGMLARQQTQGNLDHVYRPGDYITAKSGTTWTLDAKGMLHPSDGSQPVPLMKRGMYSNTAMQLAESGRVGYGSVTREQRRSDNARRRQTALDIEAHQTEVDREMRLAVQREGLQSAAEAEPRPDVAEKQARQERIMSRPLRAQESQVGSIVRMIFKAPTDAKSVISAIAQRNGVSPEEVMRLQLANDPEHSQTPQSRVARLEIGDTVSDEFRKDRPWKVEQGKDGNLYLRSGNASPLKLDRLNPSDRILQLVERGEVATDRPEFTGADAQRAAFDTPHYVRHQEELAQKVKDRAEGKAKDPEPRNEQQANVQAEAAAKRADAAEAVATRAVVEALEPPPEATVESAEGKAEDATQAVRVAEEGYAQKVEAAVKASPKDQFPPRAPATIGLRGSTGTITQNSRDFPFHYELLPIEGLVASHVWSGRQMVVNEDFPPELQPRTISENEALQNALRAERRSVGTDGRTSGYNFNEYADKTINGTMGPAIVEQGGRIVGGNTRISIMRKHLENLAAISDVEEREAHQYGFKAAMRKMATESGIPEFPDDGKDYVVVRMLDKPIEDTREAAELGRLFNKPISVQISKSARGVSYAKSLDKPILEDIARRVEGYDGLIPAMQADPEFFRDIVTNRFGVDPVEFADWFDDVPGRGLVLNEQGRNQFSKTLMGTVIKDTAILNRIEGKTPYRALERALGYMVKMGALPHRDIIGKITEAAQAAAETMNVDPGRSRSNDRWLATYHPDQQQFLGMETEAPPEPDRMVEAIWRAMHSSDAAVPRVFNDRLKSFLGDESSKALNMFSAEREETPSEAFNRAFARELTEVKFSRRDSQEGIGPEEYDQSLKNRETSDVQRTETDDMGKGGRGESPEQSEEGGEAPSWDKDENHLDPVDSAIAEGYSNAVLIPWVDRDSQKSIAAARADLESKGWKWNPEKKQLEKDGWYAWFRSQGDLSAPIVQWSKLADQKEEFKKKGITAPPKPPTKKTVAERDMGITKAEQGYVTPAKLKEFLEAQPETRDHAGELMRTARLMAEYVYDIDPPVGVDRKEAMDWVLKERLAGIERGNLKTKAGSYSDPNIEKNFADRVMKLHQAANPSTFIHEFAHVIFPMLSDQDLKDIDTIRGKAGHVWDGERGTLTGKTYADLSEKLAHGLEQFLRDENPTGFTHEVKAVLAKIKEIMRKVYLKFAGDPLSEFANTEESREVFSKMFGITSFELQDDWRKEVKKARAEEKKMRKPDEEPHPIQKQATEAGASGIRNAFSGKVEDSIGSRIDPRQPVAVFVFPDANKAATYWSTQATKLDSAELIQADDGVWGVRFNTKSKVPSNLLYQDVPRKHAGIELDEAKKRLASTPDSAPMVRKLLQVKINNLENEIRSRYGAETESALAPPDAKQVVQEVKNGRTDAVRKATDGEPAVRPAGGITEVPKPPNAAKPANDRAAAGRVDSRRPVARVPASLAEVKPVGLEPLREARGTPVGRIAGEAFDHKAWTDNLKAAGLPENLPPPTWALDRKTAEKLIFPGQPEVVQTALSALEQGDGAIVATSTGTGKTYSATAIAREWRIRHPEAKILYVTKNAGLLKSAQDVALNTFGFEVDKTIPDKDAPAGTYAATYSRIIRDDAAKNTKWDLVIADESGEARNWFQEENRQGKALMAITANSGKAVYFSATPFHSPMEYGYLNKLNMWPKNGFDRWIENNFAHEKINDKVVARLDPAKQAKLRQQLIERGQLVSQAISYEGFTAHFGVVPVTDAMKRGLDRIHEGFARAKKQLVDMKKKGLAEKIAAFEATYTKAFLERERLPQAIEIAHKAREAGWQVAIFSETSSEDLFRRPREQGMEPSTYQQLDDAMGGGLSRIIPPFPNIYDRLREEFGEEIGDYSGRGNSMAERERAKTEYLQGKTPMLYTTFAAGGIGVSLHDADFPELGVKGGDKPRISLFLGPPYSGVLLEQSMGRGWRFGVKSDHHAVFLATDSEPDVRLMQQKVGPRMRALRASVLGEKDSLANVMGSYTDEEKVRVRQEALAYQEGNEPEMDATSYQVRSKTRNVGINDWSMINFPPAETAKNKGMKYGADVVGGDWSTLYQSKHGMLFPDEPQVAAGKDTVDAIGNGLSTGKSLPAGVSVQILDPVDRDVVVGAASATATDAVEQPVQRDTEAVARQSMQSQFNLPGEKDKWILTFPQGKGGGVWKYTGDPADLIGGPEGEPRGRKDIRTWYLANMFSQEVGIKSIAKQAGALEAGEEIVRMNRSYQADADTHFASFAMEAHDVMRDNKLDTDDPKTMAELWDTVEGKRATDNPAIQKAANAIADLHERVHGEEAKADVKLKTPAGETISWKTISKDRNFMPHRIDWDAQIEDPLTGEKHILRDIMKETFAEAKRRRIIDAIAQERGYTYDQVVDYLKAYAPNTPVLGHIHRARTLNFPFIKKDWKTLMGYYRQASDALAIEKNFGHERSKLDREIARIPSENGRRTITSMFDGILQPGEWEDWTAKVYNGAIAFEAATKMTLSVTKVPFHLVHVPVGLKGRVKPLVRAMLRTALHPKEVMENATYVGTIARQLNVADVISAPDSQGITHQIFGKTGFNATYKVVRAIAGESSRIWMEQYAMKELKKGNPAEARRLLRDVMLIGDGAIDQAIANGKFSPEDLAKGQTAFANLTTWSNNPLQMPGWARLHIDKNENTMTVGLKRAVRLSYALQSFSLKSTSLLREQLWTEVATHKNYKPLAYAVVAYPIIGQMLLGTAAGAKHFVATGIRGLSGSQKQGQDSWDKFIAGLEDLGEHPTAVKFLKYWVDGVTLGVAWDRTRRVMDPFLNMAEGKNAEARGEFRYMWEDELNQDLGPAFNEVVEAIKLGANVGVIESAEKHPEQKGPKVEAATKKYATQVVPILKQVPFFAPPSKQKTVKKHY